MENIGLEKEQEELEYLLIPHLLLMYLLLTPAQLDLTIAMLTTENIKFRFVIAFSINFINKLFLIVQELVSWVNNSDADFVILGGDFNTDPNDKETSYHNLKKAMFSSMEEFFHDIKVIES